MIVQKFGGTSVRDAEAIQRVAGIVGRAGPEPRLVVVSALSGVTNALLEIGAVAPAGRCVEALVWVEELRGRHRAVAAALPGSRSEASGCVAEIDRLFDELRTFVEGLSVVGETSPRSADLLVSYGERLSSLILHAGLLATGLPASLADARSFLVTDARHTQAVPDWDATRQRLEETVGPELDRCGVVVTQGFIGSTRDGVTTTIGRGGSDYSAAIFGSLLRAREIQIWTDVDGILTADPGLVHEARRIRLMSFREAAELSYFGARVLHPATIRPAIDRNIPVRVLNSTSPGCDGTLIVAGDGSPDGCRVKSVAYKEGISVITIVSDRMFLSPTFLEEVFGVFRRCRTVVHTVAASDVSVSVTVNGDGDVDEVAKALDAFSSVTVERHRAVVAVVGERLREARGMAARIFGVLEGENVNMISLGASEVNLSFVVDESRLEPVVRKLHAELFRDAGRYPEVFA